MRHSGIDQLEITGAERDRLLALEEGHYGDLKAIDVQPKKLGKSISAFANAAGGDLYVGIGESILHGTKVRYLPVLLRGLCQRSARPFSYGSKRSPKEVSLSLLAYCYSPTSRKPRFQNGRGSNCIGIRPQAQQVREKRSPVCPNQLRDRSMS